MRLSRDLKALLTEAKKNPKLARIEVFPPEFRGDKLLQFGGDVPDEEAIEAFQTIAVKWGYSTLRYHLATYTSLEFFEEYKEHFAEQRRKDRLRQGIEEPIIVGEWNTTKSRSGRAEKTGLGNTASLDS